MTEYMSEIQISTYFIHLHFKTVMVHLTMRFINKQVNCAKQRKLGSSGQLENQQPV